MFAFKVFSSSLKTLLLFFTSDFVKLNCIVVNLLQVALLEAREFRSHGGQDHNDLDTRSVEGHLPDDLDLADQQRPLQVASEDQSPWHFHC